MSHKFIARLKYLLRAHYRNGHHVHSPYTYRVCRNILFERWEFYSFEALERFRRKRGYDGRMAKYEQILQRLCADSGARSVVEVGLGDGISTMYLASNRRSERVCVLERDNRRIEAARRDWELLGYGNIYVTEDEWPERVDFMYCNEAENMREAFEECRGRATENCIMVFRGIHDDEAKEAEWREIAGNEDVRISMDLFEVGVVWLNEIYQKQHYTIKI